MPTNLGSIVFAVSLCCCISVRKYVILSIEYHPLCLKAAQLFIVGDWILLRLVFFITMTLVVE